MLRIHLGLSGQLSTRNIMNPINSKNFVSITFHSVKQDIMSLKDLKPTD